MKMTDQRKKEIADHYMEAVNREELHTGEAGRYLNLNPCYLSMVKTPKHWSSMSQAAWDRLEEWHETRDKIAAFVIPEGEEIFKKPERKASLPEEGELINVKATSREKKKGSPPPLDRKAKKADKRKTVELDARLEDAIGILHARLEDAIGILRGQIRVNDLRIEVLEDLVEKLNNKVSSLTARLETHSPVSAPKPNNKRKHSGIIFFQRNYYKS